MLFFGDKIGIGEMMSFKKAERKAAKLKLAITGPSGSGKTLSALRLAKGLGGKIAVIDTENKSASLYSDRFEFDVLEIDPPYTNQKYLDSINLAVKGKYDILIIDSLTHQWAGEGGLLNKKEQMDARGGNSFANWAKMTPEHEKFKSAILHADIHVIGTLRSKTEYTLSQNDKGKQVPQKLGMAPIQRDGIEYEFTTVFDVHMNHEAETSKDRSGLWIGQIFQITEETGVLFKRWLDAAAPAQKKSPDPQGDFIFYFDPEIMKGFLSAKRYDGKKLKEIPRDHLEKIFRWCMDSEIDPDFCDAAEAFMNDNPLFNPDDVAESQIDVGGTPHES
jgi:AAA domain